MSGVLTELRKLRPPRRLKRAEAFRVAEQQAQRLLKLRGLDNVTDAPVAEELITHLPHLVVQRYPLGPTISGLAHWSSGRWCVALNGDEPLVRQRFSLAHELGHIIEAPFGRYADSDSVERIADHFAACLLMPKSWVKQLWGDGVQDPAALARHFQVSKVAMTWRLTELGLQVEADPAIEQVLTRHGAIVPGDYGGTYEPVAAA